MNRVRMLIPVLCVAFAAVAKAQTSSTDDDSMPSSPMVQQSVTGHVARSTVGIAGERLTRESVVPNIAPTTRIRNRIDNRVQSRINNRIDRNYTQRRDVVDAYEAAQDRGQRTSSRR